MKKIACLLITIVILLTCSALAEGNTPGRQAFSDRIWNCTGYMAEGDGELAAFAFCKDFYFALFDYTNDVDSEALEDQQLVVYDARQMDVIYIFESLDRLSIGLIEDMTRIYGDAKVPESLFDGFILDGNAPRKLFSKLTSEYNCTVLWYGAY